MWRVDLPWCVKKHTKFMFNNCALRFHLADNFTLAFKLKPDDKELPGLIEECKKQLGKRQLVEQGKAELAAKSYPDAVGTFTKALAFDPEDEEVKALLEEAKRRAEAQRLKKIGEDQLADKKYKAAAATLLKALQLEPEDDVVVREHEEAVSKAKAAQLQKLGEEKLAVSDLPCEVRREGGQSLVIGGPSLVILEGREGNPL